MVNQLHKRLRGNFKRIGLTALCIAALLTAQAQPPYVAPNCANVPPAQIQENALAGFDKLGVFNGHTYYISRNYFIGLEIASVVNNAQSQLPGQQVYAAAIVNKAENDAITCWMLAYNEMKYGVTPPADQQFYKNFAPGNKSTFPNWGDPRNPWIGFSDLTNETNFTWLNGQPNCENFTYWNVEEPNNYNPAIGEDFTQMLIMHPYNFDGNAANGNEHDPVGRWNDWFNQYVSNNSANGETRLPVIIEVGPADCTPLLVNLKSSTPVNCFGNTDGSATFEITSGAAPYTYQLDGGTETAAPSNPFTLTGLAAGNHTLLVKDANGTTKSVNFFISQPASALVASASNVVKEGCDGAKGSVTISATGGTANYTVVKNGEMTSYAVPKTYTGLTAGNYTFTVTDKNGCTSTVNVTIGKENCETTGNEGCTPGYWKNHTNSWGPAGLSPNQTAGSIFTFNGLFPTLSSKSLLATLNGGGGSGAIGGATVLLRAAVAAMLNAAHPSVDYPITQASIISQVNAALATNNKDAMNKLATKLDGYNNKGCPINAHGVESSSRTLLNMETAQPIDKAFAVSGYPNPTRNSFNLQINGLLNEKVTVRVVDMAGRLIEQRTNLSANQVISIGANYKTGVYNIEVIQGEKREQLRLLKQ